MSIFLDTATIAFYISFFGIIGMMYLKYFENKNDKKYFLSNISSLTDKYVLNAYNFTKRLILGINKKNAIALIQWIAYHILSWARDTYIWLYRKARSHPPSKMVVDMVRGRGEIKRNGGTSFYLRRIAQKDEDSVK